MVLWEVQSLIMNSVDQQWLAILEFLNKIIIAIHGVLENPLCYPVGLA